MNVHQRAQDPRSKKQRVIERCLVWLASLKPRQLIYGAAALVAVVAVGFGVRALVNRPGAPDQTSGTQGAQASAQPQAEASALPAPTLAASEQPASGQPTPTPKPPKGFKSDLKASEVDMLPVISTKKRETEMVAITIDDCFQTDNVREIMALAKEHNAGLTFFPKGNLIADNADLWREVYEAGFEIENHSYPHSDVTKLSDVNLYNAIRRSETAINEALGGTYDMRFFRCPGGAGEKLPRMHKMLGELGYEAIAHWGLSGTRPAAETISMAKPGHIILFHATDKDLKRLKKVIPELAKKYKLVDLNTLYGKEANTLTPLEEESAGTST